MNIRHVPVESTLFREDFTAVVTLKRFDVTKTVNCGQVCPQVVLQLENLSADVTLESLDVTNTVNSSHVTTY